MWKEKLGIYGIFEIFNYFMNKRKKHSIRNSHYKFTKSLSSLITSKSNMNCHCKNWRKRFILALWDERKGLSHWTYLIDIRGKTQTALRLVVHFLPYKYVLKLLSNKITPIGSQELFALVMVSDFFFVKHIIQNSLCHCYHLSHILGSNITKTVLVWN